MLSIGLVSVLGTDLELRIINMTLIEIVGNCWYIVIVAVYETVICISNITI